MLRDFLWNYFSSTGDIESYLLYKDHEHFAKRERDEEDLESGTNTGA